MCFMNIVHAVSVRWFCYLLDLIFWYVPTVDVAMKGSRKQFVCLVNRLILHWKKAVLVGMWQLKRWIVWTRRYVAPSRSCGRSREKRYMRRWSRRTMVDAVLNVIDCCDKWTVNSVLSSRVAVTACCPHASLFLQLLTAVSTVKPTFRCLRYSALCIALWHHIKCSSPSFFYLQKAECGRSLWPLFWPDTLLVWCFRCK